MLSFLRRVLCCADELNTGHSSSNSEIYTDDTPSQSYYISPNPPVISTQTAQSQNDSISNNFPQKPNTPPPVNYNQPKQIPPRNNNVKGFNPEKKQDIPPTAATHTNDFVKPAASSSSYKSAGSITNPVSDQSEHFPKSTSKQRNPKRNIKVARDPNLKIASLWKLGNDYPQTTRKPRRKKSTGSSTITHLPPLPHQPPSLNLDSSSLDRCFARGQAQMSGGPRKPRRTLPSKDVKGDTDGSPGQHTTENDYPRTTRKPRRRKSTGSSSTITHLPPPLTHQPPSLNLDDSSSSSDPCCVQAQGPRKPRRRRRRTLPSKDVKGDIDGSPGQYTTVPARRSLADYLRESGPRLVSLYDSTELYPTDEARCIIQGMIRAILNLKKGEMKHNYLRHPENIILGEKECHPYSNYVLDLATEDVIRNRRILEQAGQDFPTSTEVTLEKNRMDSKSDDLEALKCLIFDVILVLDDGKKPRLPAEWISFKKLFSNTKLEYAVLSSHPCLWGYTKRLGFYFALNKWRKPSKSEKEVRDIVDGTLSSMKIFRTNWVQSIKRESHLKKFARDMRPRQQRQVYVLIRTFRNLVEHCSDEASPSSPYREERYLDYKLRTLYPNLLEEIHQRLLLAGFIY